jgi:pyridoxal phosphate-dependent aminotransferase EpsN
MAVNSSQMKRIYLSPPHLEGDELEFVKDSFASNWIAPVGAHVDAFEREVAELVGLPCAVALSSGTAAIHLALRLSEIKPAPARLFMKADIPCSLIQTEQPG